MCRDVQLRVLSCCQGKQSFDYSFSVMSNIIFPYMKVVLVRYRKLLLVSVRLQIYRAIPK